MGDPSADIITPLLDDFLVDTDICSSHTTVTTTLTAAAIAASASASAAASASSSSVVSVEEHHTIPNPLSGRCQLKLQSNFGKWIALFDNSSETHSQAKQEYNRRQRAAIETFKEVDGFDFSSSNSREKDSQDEKESRENWAINLSNAANIFLLIVKVYACVKSGSIAIVASTLDSLLDLIAGAILWFTRSMMSKHDVYNFPIGKSRIQPVGIVIFAAIMATLGVQVLIEAVSQLLQHSTSSKLTTSELVWLCSIMGLATVVKIALFLYCRTFDNEIVQAYSQDHSFDVLTNVVGLAAALLANWFYWWIDPVGAILLSVYTITNWTKTVLENAVSLIGKGAPPEMIQKLTYMALRHSTKIVRIDTVRAYTFGARYFVEVDIELPEEMALKEAHDIGQALQDKFECLPEVERAFVHLDHESRHKPEHSAQR